MAKATYSLDDATLDLLRRTAARQRKPQSQIVREAVAEYAARTDRLSESERRQLLDVLARVRASVPTRSEADVDAELADLKAARRQGGRDGRAK